jgi:membrane-bound inhibitor of C-type lysozyme
MAKATMSKHHLQNLRRSFLEKSPKSQARNGGRGYRRSLNMESLEPRQMMSVTQLQNITVSQDAGLKPQSKIFEYAGQWWTVMPNKMGTWVHRLDGTTWTQTQQISTNKKVHADVKMDGDMAHVLLFSGSKSQVATLQYDAVDNRFEAWSQQPNLVNVSLSGQTATIELDSTNRLWIASNGKSGVEARYSDGLHTTWSGPITIAPKISSRDMSCIIAMPDDTIGIFWSDQKTKRFGFRTHQDGAAATTWSANEVPGSQSALNIGHGMADDHMHLAVTSNNTLYAAVKTGYDRKGVTLVGLLVRRPNHNWDNIYTVSDTGTRGVVVVDETAGQLIVAYTTATGGGDIVYKTSPLDVISFSAAQVLIPGKVNNVTTAKVTSSNQVVFLADSKSALFTFDVAPPAVTSTFVASASSFSVASSTGGGPTSNDLALEDPNLVNGARFGSLPLGTSVTQTAGTSV